MAEQEALGNLEPAKKGGLFKKYDNPDVQAPPASMAEEVQNIGRRLRMIEERYSNLRRKMQLIEQNMISHYNELQKSISSAEDEMTEIKRDFAEGNKRIGALVEEVKRCAKKEDIDVLKKYIDIWDPLNFVTFKQMEELISKKIDENLKK